MILAIDTIDRNKIKLALADQKTEFFEFETGDQSADLLLIIEKTLKKNKLSLKDITAVVVNQGTGSFTGVRVGIAVGNALAWSLNIPVIGYRDENIDDAIAKVSKLKKFSKIALPSYPSKN